MAIDEYTLTGVRQDHQFEFITYLKIFTQLMVMQAKIDANPKHAAMTRALRINWAKTGRCVVTFPPALYYLIHYIQWIA